ncbi:MAG TPA: TonB-dependent receptor plug domain-containing protein [Gemmatimonadaceae bacterium]|nr:TonB-dependent receptor plug domain-containing protein [Gemmatimonadaceae bacterium]
MIRIRFASGVAPALLIAGALLAGCSSATTNRAADPEESSVASDGRSMQEMFEGRFPGVEVGRAASGGITIRIRGASTVMGSAEPLYIIDGARVQSGPGGLLFLDPMDIKKIEVLKDIGSTSMYGSEGANGVIIITTKRAR